ncbi:MAG: transcriptional activator NhaR [Acidobacteriota bacterium]
MDWLNYHHLYYFWMVAQEGTVTAASRKLLLSQPTVSAQIKKLEEGLGSRLFQKTGRNLTLTETGELVFRYADDIFSLGAELLDAVKGRAGGKPLRLTVGVSDAVPKLVAFRILQTALRQHVPLMLRCYEGKQNDLLARLAVHDLDAVLTDTPVGPDVSIRAFSFLLGESEIGFFAAPALAHRFGQDFPKNLDGAPFLLPAGNTALRKALNHWFEVRGLVPRIEAEFDDSALLRAFGNAGAGIFPAPVVASDDIRSLGTVEEIGRATDLRERFYAISLERKVKHPAVLAITRDCRSTVFAG